MKIFSTLRTAALVSLASASLAASATPALADGEFEPNDSIATAATVPFNSHTVYMARLETEADVDVYEFDLSNFSDLDDLEITVTNLASSNSRCLDVQALDVTGTPVLDGRAQPTPCGSAERGVVQILRPANNIVLLRVKASGPTGGVGNYAFEVGQGASNPSTGGYEEGFRARLAGTGADDTQSISVYDEKQRQYDERVGSTKGSTPRKLRLRQNVSAAVRFTFLAESTEAGWSWDWTLTSQDGDPTTRKTVFAESASSVTLIKPVAGLVRRVVVNGVGTVLSTECGVGVIAVPCGNVPTTPTAPVDPSPSPAPVAAPAPTPVPPVPGVPAPTPKPAPAVVKLVGTFKVSGKGKTVKGKLSATNPTCLAGAKVSLLQQAAKPKKGKKAKADKTLGSATSKKDGSWTITLKKAAKGKTYVKVAPAAKNAAACATATSKTKTI